MRCSLSATVGAPSSRLRASSRSACAARSSAEKALRTEGNISLSSSEAWCSTFSIITVILATQASSPGVRSSHLVEQDVDHVVLLEALGHRVLQLVEPLRTSG